jgi:hypothetical protein
LRWLFSFFDLLGIVSEQVSENTLTRSHGCLREKRHPK